MAMISELYLHVEVGSIRIDEAAAKAIELRDRLGVSLSLDFAAGSVLVFPGMSIDAIVQDYQELITA